MNQNEKKLLTINDLIRNNKISKVAIFVAIIFLTIFIVVMIIFTLFIFYKSEQNLMPALFVGIFSLAAFGTIALLIKQLKKEKNENAYIESGNYRIVEDKIYDKYMRVSHDSDGPDTYYYYVYSKIYGKISTDVLVYNNSQKDDIIYLLFYNGNENIGNYNGEIDEYKRNSKIIDQNYLASYYELSSELKHKLISYNEALGETNFNNRTKELINKLEMTKNNIKCKNCNNKYNLKRNDFCPNCGFVNKFDIVDIVHNKEWYDNKHKH